MPPRIPTSSIHPPPASQCLRVRSQLRPETSPSAPARQFHATPRNDKSRLRVAMWAWLNGPGKAFRQPLKGSTNYLGAYDRQGRLERGKLSAEDDAERQAAARFDPELDEDEGVIQQREEEAGLQPEEIEKRAEDRARRRLKRDEIRNRGNVPKERLRDLRPYPSNQAFRSQPVLSEALREELYTRVVEDKMDLNSVSAVYGVDVRRVAAVVRLKTIEKQWVLKGKPLAKPYNDAVLEMLPQTPLSTDSMRPIPHESINDLPVHPWTRQQIFHPTSESTQFTRADAARVFHEKLLPADERIPNKQLIQIQKWENEGIDRRTRQKMIREMDAKERAERLEKEREHAEYLKRTQVVVPGRRWDFQFTDISAENVGKDGRGRNGVGHRYGMPHEDRKRGMVKIPTSVE